MLYSVKHNFIFSQNPRSASTSTALLLEPMCAAPGHVVRPASPEVISDYGIIGQRGVHADSDIFYVHMPLEEIRDRMDADKWSAARKICNVRNPFGKFLSGFSRLVRIGQLGPFETFEAERAAFDTAMRQRVVKDSDPAVPDFQKTLFLIGDEFMIDDVIYFEDLNAQIAGLLSRLGADSAAELPHMQGSFSSLIGNEMTDYYTPDLTALVADTFRWSFDTFGYSTDPSEYLRMPAATAAAKPSLCPAPVSKE